MRSIQEMGQEIKNRLGDGVTEWGTIIIVFLLALASFGLGRLSAQEEARPLVSVGEAAQGSKAPALAAGGLVVASKSGTAYHFPWCAGASSIKESNKIWFKDEAAARRAGYAPAKNCKGLQ